MRNLSHPLLAAALAALLAAGCATKPVEEPPAPQAAPAPAPAPTPAPSPAPAPAVAAPVAPAPQLDPNDLTNPANLRNAVSILSKRNVFFDYDKYDIKPEFQDLVAAHGKLLAANPQLKILLQGNADERGSREYNLALGQKRAEAVKKAMQLLGARESQIEAVSLGEEKPVCTQSVEDCWWRNRRADILHASEY